MVVVLLHHLVEVLAALGDVTRAVVVHQHGREIFLIRGGVVSNTLCAVLQGIAQAWDGPGAPVETEPLK